MRCAALVLLVPLAACAEGLGDAQPGERQSAPIVTIRQATLPAEQVLEYAGPIRQDVPYLKGPPLKTSAMNPATAIVVAPPRPPMPAPVRSVPGTGPFRGSECEYDPDHVCNRCGATQLVIARWNSDGTHTHICSQCGHSWRHR